MIYYSSHCFFLFVNHDFDILKLLFWTPDKNQSVISILNRLIMRLDLFI